MKVKIVALLISLIYAPWWLYLSYLILQKIGATELMWFMFWVSIPLVFSVSILSKLAEWEEK